MSNNLDDDLPLTDSYKLLITESVLLKEIEWLRSDYARLVTKENPNEDEVLQNCYASQAIEHLKFVLAYFDAKYDKL